MRRLLNRLARFDKKGLVKLALLGVAVALCLGVLLASVIQIASTMQQRNAAGDEYDALRNAYSPNATVQGVSSAASFAQDEQQA